MNQCFDCRWLQRGPALEDNRCFRPGANQPMCVRDRYSRSPTACGQVGRFFQPAMDRGIGRKSFGDDE